MLKLFLFLNLVICADAFAQRLGTPTKSPVFQKAPQFTSKMPLGNWDTNTSDFNHSLFATTYASGDTLPPALINPAVTCVDDHLFMLSYQQQKNLNGLASSFTKLQCQEADRFKETKELNPEICLMMANCYKNTLAPGENGYDIKMKARQKTAAEVVALMASTTIAQMYDLQELKAYAVAKYDEDFIPEECRADDSLFIPYNENETACLTGVIDKGYEIAQRNCHAAEMGCEPDYLNFIQDKTAEPGKTSLVGDFIKYQTKEKAKVYTVEDEPITQEVAQLMTDESKTPEVRTQSVMKYLGDNFTRLDPVYKNYVLLSNRNKSSGEPDEIYEGLLKYIKTNKGRPTLEIMSELNVLRQKEAGKRLAESCHKTMSLQKLCRVIRDVLNGAEVQVPKKNFDKMLKRQTAATNPKNTQRQDLADNVSRCNTFAVLTSFNKEVTGNSRLSSGLELFANGVEGMIVAKDIGFGIASISTSQENRSQITLGEKGEVSSKDRLSSGVSEKLSSVKEERPRETVLVEKFSNNLVMQSDPKRPEASFKALSHKALEKIEGPEQKINSSKEEIVSRSLVKDSETVTGMQQQAQNQNLIGVKNVLPPVTRHQDTIIDPQVEPVIRDHAAKPQQPAADYTSLMNKIAGLEEKLASSKKKSTVEATPSDPKAAEETDLAREIRMAKDSLAEIAKENSDNKINTAASTTAGKSKTRKIKSESVTEVEEDDSESDDGVISSAGTSKEVRSVAAVAPQAASSGTGSNSSSSSGAERSGAVSDEMRSGSGGANSGSGSEGNTSQNSDGPVLTRLDGVSRSKASETITNMILAESGKSFYIEEGGLVKEIIPEVVDGVIKKDDEGTPIYKTVVKGKVGEFKIESKDGKGKKVKREIAVKAASPADVKMQDYQKVNSAAVRYIELQQIFNPKK